MDSLGVFVLRPEQPLEIYHAIPRKTRKDALFLDEHPDEIVFPIDLDGRYYRKIIWVLNTSCPHSLKLSILYFWTLV